MNKKRTCLVIFTLVFVIATTVAVSATQTKLLDIPWRHQWLNDGGYCGETCIQSAALFNGTYISQSLARTYGGGEVIVGADVDPPYGNASAVYDKLKLTYDRWDYIAGGVWQYQDFLNWTKAHLNQDHPVLFGVYTKDGNDPDFDHIIPAIGFSATSVSTYSNNDTITFYDNFLPNQSYTRTFGSFYDRRNMRRNGAIYYYCLPKKYDYGDAITGIEDPNDETYPVKLAVDVNDEPNVSQGASPVNMNATITISELTPGNTYLLLRYNDYTNIPNQNFKQQSSQASSVVTFTATGATAIVSDTIMSDTMAAYRCVSY